MHESGGDSSESFFTALQQRIGIIPLVLGFLGIVVSIFGVGAIVRSQSTDMADESFVIDEASASAALSSLIVDVQGAVEKPGIVKLESGARIQEALAAAGGLSSTADHEYVGKVVNQAAKVSDGMKIYIPFEGEQASGNSQVGSTAKGVVSVLGTQANVVNINTASLSELDTLEGIGEKTAQKIVAGRPYQRPEELVEKKIVGQAVWGKIKDSVSVY